MPQTTAAERFLPLSPAAFHILLALFDSDLHGYAITKEVQAKTNGELRLGAGTLYGALKRMLADGMVVEVDDVRQETEAGRRYYRITALGRAVVKADASRLARLVRFANAKRILEPGAI